VSFELSPEGNLTFENAAVAAGVASAPSGYQLTWSRFDNVTAADVGPREETRISEPNTRAPASLLQDAAFVSLTVRTTHADYPRWEQPVRVFFRRAGPGWQTVGLERLP
jgi:hypothetical protein